MLKCNKKRKKCQKKCKKSDKYIVFKIPSIRPNEPVKERLQNLVYDQTNRGKSIVKFCIRPNERVKAIIKLLKKEFLNCEL